MGQVTQTTSPVILFEGNWVTPPPSTLADISSDIQCQGSGILSAEICFHIYLSGIYDVI